jgi:hypothetical protein
MKNYLFILTGLLWSFTAFAQTSETLESKRWYKELSPKIAPSYYAVAKQQAPAMILGLRNDIPNPTLIALLTNLKPIMYRFSILHLSNHIRKE